MLFRSKKLAPDRFEDIIAVLALYRPGPLGSGMVDDFILRKKGLQKIDFFHESLKACLTPTYGVIVYQEQVMQISQLIGGYTLGAADMLRRAMGKKKPEEMAQHRGMFSEGATKNGIDGKLAMQLFDLMEKFAEYGFNKSHTAAYAVVTYQTAWLKAHHASAFMAATLSSDMDNTDTVKIFHDDAKANGLTILGPDINASEFRFAPVDAQTIRYGLGAVKGTGENAVNEIVAAREAGGPFKDLFDFCERVDRRVVNRRAMEALVRAGAFDALDAERSRVLSQVGLAIETAEQAAANAHQNSLFGMDDVAPALNASPGSVEAVYPTWSDRQKLIEEKAALGFFFSNHPFSILRDEVRTLCPTPISRLEAGRDASLVAGIVTDVRTQMTRRGKMAFVTLDDGEGRIEAAVFSELFDAQRHKLRTDELLLVEGKVSRDEFRDALKLGVDRLLTFNEARAQWASRLWLDLRGLDLRAMGGVRRIHDLLQPFAQLLLAEPGGAAKGCPVSLTYRNGAAEAELALGDSLRVRPDTDLIDALSGLLGRDRVRLDYQLGTQQRVRQTAADPSWA